MKDSPLRFQFSILQRWMVMAKIDKRKKKENKPPKPRIKEKVAEVLELPREVVLNVPKLTMIGSGNLMIENYKGIIEYDDTLIRVNTGTGVIRVSGERLFLKEITSEDIMVDGDIKSLEFIK